MSRIVFAAAMIASALAFAQHERTFERTGMLGLVLRARGTRARGRPVARVPARPAHRLPRPLPGLVHAPRDAR